ncbi:hypothetical protein J7K50_09490 [bacterium]|nr:hypothetical protein [bacterium]
MSNEGSRAMRYSTAIDSLGNAAYNSQILSLEEYMRTGGVFAFRLLVAVAFLFCCILLQARQVHADDLDLIFDRVDQTLDVLGQSPVERLITILEQRIEIIVGGESKLETAESKKFLKRILGDSYFIVKDEGYTLNLDWAFLSSVLEDYSPDANEQNKLLSEYIITRWNLWDCQDIAFYTILARLYVKAGRAGKLVTLLNDFSPKTGGRTFWGAMTGKGGGPYANIRRSKLVELYRIGLEYLAKEVSPDRLEQWVSDMSKWDEEGKVKVGRIEIPGDMFFSDMPGETHHLRATTLYALLKFKKENDREVLDILTRDVAMLLETMLRRGQFDVASDELLYLNRVRKELKLTEKKDLEELYITLLPINQKNRQIQNEKERLNRERIILWDKKREELFSRHPELQYMDQFLEELQYPKFFTEDAQKIGAQKVNDSERDTWFEQNKVMIYVLTAILDELGV